jgi:hypothetical protein
MKCIFPLVSGSFSRGITPIPDKKVDDIIRAFGIVLLNVNPIADHIDEIKGRDGTISFNNSWTNEVHLVHFVDLCRIQDRVSVF